MSLKRGLNVGRVLCIHVNRSHDMVARVVVVQHYLVFANRDGSQLVKYCQNWNRFDKTESVGSEFCQFITPFLRNRPAGHDTEAGTQGLP